MGYRQFQAPIFFTVLKMLEKIMYNRVYEHSDKKNNLLYKKQFGFQKAHFTKYAIIQLVEQISNSFEKKLFSTGGFY